jgi:hypothetical protein
MFLKISKPALVCVSFFSLLYISYSRAECNLDLLIGYTLVAVKHISETVDKGERKDDFEGCDFDKVVVFDDQTGLRCATYLYNYSFLPKAYIFSNARSIKMCVNGELMDMMPLH